MLLQLASQHSRSPGRPHTAQSASQSSCGGGASLPAPSVSSGSGVPPRTPAFPRRILSLGAGPFTAFAPGLQAGTPEVGGAVSRGCKAPQRPQGH